jgi:hypothetical protein
MQQIKPMNPFLNVAASGQANCDLNNFLGTNTESFNLLLGGTSFTKSMITSLQITANGKVIFDTDGSKLDATESYKNWGTVAATILHVNLMEQKALTVNAFQAGSWILSPEAGITQLKMFVTIAGATAPTLAGWAELSTALPMVGEENIRYLLGRRHRVQQTIGASGYSMLAVPHIDPTAGGSLYKRINVYSANMTDWRIIREGIAEFDVSVAMMNQLQKKAGRAPQSNLCVFDPTLDHVLTGRAWDTRPDNQIHQAQVWGNFSGGETITIETEELLPLSVA